MFDYFNKPDFIFIKKYPYYKYMPVFCPQNNILYLVNIFYWNNNEFPINYWSYKEISIKNDIRYVFFVNNYREFSFDTDYNFYNEEFDLFYMLFLEQNSIIPNNRNNYNEKKLLCYNSCDYNNNFRSYSEYIIPEINLPVHIGMIPFIL